jgi:hypothetical protein
MKKNILLIFTLLVIILNGQAAPQSAPVLTSPADNSVHQKAINLQLTWEAIAGNPIYNVQYSTDSNFTTVAGSVSVSGNSIIIGQLGNNTVYYWRVRINQQDAPWSEVWSFRTTPLPAVPQVYLPANDTRNHDIPLTFSWSSNEINKSFLLQVSLNSSFLGSSSSYIAADTFLVVSGLVNNLDYYWRVKGLNADNVESGWSSVYHFKTRLHTPANLLPVSGSRNSDTSITFTWVSPDSPVTHHFQLAEDSLFTEDALVFDSLLNADSVSLSSLNFNTEYFWRIITFNGDGDSSRWTNTYNFKTKLQSPGILSSADSVINSDTTFSVIWNTIPGAENYLVQLSNDGLFSETIINTSVTDTVFSLHSLDFFQQYYLRIAVANQGGDMSSWKVLSFKTKLENPRLLFPADSAKNVQPDAAFTWNKITGADGYNLIAAFDSLLTKVFIDTTITDTLFSSDSLAFDTTYYWRVSGFNSLGDSSNTSGIYRFKTRPPVLFSFDSLDVRVNLSRQRSDSLAVLSVSNAGSRAYVIDSIKISPDSVFTINKLSSTISPGSEQEFYITYSVEKADTGLTKGVIHFIRNNFPVNDTLSVKFNFYLEKSVPTFSDSSLAYDSTDAVETSLQKITFRNWGGNIPLLIDSLVIEGTDTAAFHFTGRIKTPVSIRSNDSVSFFIEFEPQRLGGHEASLYIQTNSYPDSLFIFPLTGIGRGGELSSTTLARIESLSDSLFEAFSENNKPIVFKNNGNAPVNISIEFSQDKFKIGNDFLKNFTVRNGDSVTLGVRYMIPDFSGSNKDTMRIIHNGFGEDTLIVYLEGSFDSLASAQKIQSGMRLNSNVFTPSDRVINENTPLYFTLDPDLLADYSHLEFRINYYTGGHGERISAANDGSYTFTVPKEIADERGMLISGQLIARNNRNKIIDSIDVFPYFNAQVILKDYKTVEIGVPRSVPAENEKDADTKWIMFGFPFDEVAADTVFKEFGGIKNMKDAEWILYEYNLAAADSFSLFTGYSFEPMKAYFAAQALRDTFKISCTYKENLRSRKLTDTLINLPGTNWKTVSSPFLFDVEVNPSVMLRYWDPNNKAYKMTNIMKPGIGYFVEPSVSQLDLKTYGEYDPLYYPKIMADIGWHLKLNVSDSCQEKENLFSIQNSDKLMKTNSGLPAEYAASPVLQKGLELYTTGENGSALEAAVHNGADGSVFSVILKNNVKDDYVNIEPEITGALPPGFSYAVYNDDMREILPVPYKNFFIKKGKEYNLKVIAGTESYINKKITEFAGQVPENYSLSQNYPNPFNPVTTINYQVPENSFVSLKVFDILGEEVITLVNEEKSPGYYKVDLNASNLASGVYLYRLSAGRFVQVKKMVLLK